MRSPRHCSTCGRVGHDARSCDANAPTGATPLTDEERVRLARVRVRALVFAEARALGVSMAEWHAAPPTPLQRGDCERGPRPCPHLRCKYRMPVFSSLGSCVLDLADEGPRTLTQIGDALQVTRERIRQLEVKAFSFARKSARRLGVTP